VSSTSRTKGSTLKSDYFTSLFESPDSLQDEKGFYFIDRNWKYFEVLLDFLRSGEWRCPKELDEETLLNEAKFYGIIPKDKKFLSDDDLNKTIESQESKRDEKILEEKKELVELVKQTLESSLLKSVESGSGSILSPIFSVSKSTIAEKFVEANLLKNGVQISRKTSIEELKESLLKLLAEDTWFELEEELPLHVAEALSRYLKYKYCLTTQVVERNLYLEWNPGNSSNSIVTSTDTRFKGTGAFYHTQICQGIQFIWKGKTSEIAKATK